MDASEPASRAQNGRLISRQHRGQLEIATTSPLTFTDDVLVARQADPDMERRRIDPERLMPAPRRQAARAYGVDGAIVLESNRHIQRLGLRVRRQLEDGELRRLKRLPKTGLGATRWPPLQDQRL